MLTAAEAGPVHRDTLLDAAKLGHLSQNYSRHIVPLVTDGLLELTLPDKPRSRDQRYRTTELGRKFLMQERGEH
ncbi:Fic family protein [Schaalia sp. JY-X159]|uniref:Fic family protein n=1 Tax=Schaalia sp. JY-X159 TaxID=2758575 RepID=UPI0037DA7161